MRLFNILFLLFTLTSLSQQKNRSNIEFYLLDNFSVNKDMYEIKSSVETNPNYDVYYIQQKFNRIEVHNAISTMSIKDGIVKSYKNRFVEERFGKSSLKEPKIDSYTAINQALNDLNINEFKNSPDGWVHTNTNNIESKLVYINKDDKLQLAWNFNIITIDHKNWYDIFVSANDGKILKIENWMINCEFDNHGNHSQTHKTEYKNLHYKKSLFKGTRPGKRGARTSTWTPLLCGQAQSEWLCAGGHSRNGSLWFCGDSHGRTVVCPAGSCRC